MRYVASPATTTLSSLMNGAVSQHTKLAEGLYSLIKAAIRIDPHLRPSAPSFLETVELLQ